MAIPAGIALNIKDLMLQLKPYDLRVKDDALGYVVWARVENNVVGGTNTQEKEQQEQHRRPAVCSCPKAAHSQFTVDDGSPAVSLGMVHYPATAPTADMSAVRVGAYMAQH